MSIHIYIYILVFIYVIYMKTGTMTTTILKMRRCVCRLVQTGSPSIGQIRLKPMYTYSTYIITYILPTRVYMYTSYIKRKGVSQICACACESIPIYYTRLYRYLPRLRWPQIEFDETVRYSYGIIYICAHIAYAYLCTIPKDRRSKVPPRTRKWGKIIRTKIILCCWDMFIVLYYTCT